MPKKRQQPFKAFKPSASTASNASNHNSEKPSRNVNDLLANLRRESAGPSAPRDLPVNIPSVPPTIREILQIPETLAPAPRRQVRVRVDRNGRRLPAGPPPPRSWVSSRSGNVTDISQRLREITLTSPGNASSHLPGAFVPDERSLIYIVLRQIALDWEFQRIYNQYHLYFIPDHVKPALIRLIGLIDSNGICLSDLKLILLPPLDTDDSKDEPTNEITVNREVTYLDLSGSIGRALKLKELTGLLYPSVLNSDSEELQESWDMGTDRSSSIPKCLLPNLTHLSLALDPGQTNSVSWKQLLMLSSKTTTITHLSLAYWPAPCFTPRARTSTVTSPQGQRLSYGGTNHYSHSLDHDWSEAVLILRMLSRNLYELEFLDLTGCSSWFQALSVRSDHDYVDWAGSWGKIGHLKLLTGRKPSQDAPTSEQLSYVEANETATRVEKHIRTMRAGKGKFIAVERDSVQ